MQRFALVGLLTLALAGCGGGSASSQAGSDGPAKTTVARSAPLRPTQLVLRGDDVGAGFLVDPAGTKHTTLAQELEHESAKARAADQRAFVGGYTATFVKPGQAGVVSEAITYRDAASARVVSTDRIGLTYAIRNMHGHRLRVPRSAPGQPRLMVAGTAKGLRLYTYAWQHGAVLELVALFGRHVSVSQLMALARRQDARLTHPTFGA
jgi:hypothetical protein